MKCPRCGSFSSVRNTVHKRNFTIRYRKCKSCGHKFKTKEMPDKGWNYKVIVKNIKKELDKL